MKGCMKNMPESRSTTVAELADALGLEYEGDGSVKITGCASLERAKPGDLVFLTQKKYRPQLENSQASAALLPPGEDYKRAPVIRSSQPYQDFIRAVHLFYQPYRPPSGIHPQAQVASTAKLGKNVSVGAFSIIGDNVYVGDKTILFSQVWLSSGVRLGNNCVIHSHVSIRENCLLGDRVTVHDGAVLGSDGFGYVKDKKGRHQKVPQTGRVIIKDDVEIGANSTIDRAALDETVIGKGTKIDNLVQIAHNVKIGENCVIMSQVGIAGSSQLGNNVIVSGQVGIADHLNIGDNVILAAKTGVTNDIPAGSIVAGYPHLDIRTWRKSWASIPRLFDLIRDIRKIKKRLDELEKTAKK
jgi:UDP-3-O-[3-hydroxymyristoyl] glucosamine N-acyltransferase